MLPTLGNKSDPGQTMSKSNEGMAFCQTCLSDVRHDAMPEATKRDNNE